MPNYNAVPGSCSNWIYCCHLPEMNVTQLCKKTQGMLIDTDLYHVNEVHLLGGLFGFPVLLKLRGSHRVPVERDVI